MKAALKVLFIIFAIVCGSQAQTYVRVDGGTLPSASPVGPKNVGSFEISATEITWGEWQKVCDWAIQHGYDIGSAGAGSGVNHPLRNVSWYEALKWCNAKSEIEGYTPVYSVGIEIYKEGEQVPVFNNKANGYRLPTEAEWEWAARGGVKSKGYKFSGSDNPDEVAWYWDNSSGAEVDIYQGHGTWPVAQKKANELGIYDMSGNVWEWCWDQVHGSYRAIRGGRWSFPADKCIIAYRANYGIPNGHADHYGFRLVKNPATTNLQVSSPSSSTETEHCFVNNRDDKTTPTYQKVNWDVDKGKIASEVVGNKYRCLTLLNDPSLYLFDCKSRKMITQIYAGGGDQNEESSNVHLTLSGDENYLFCEQLFCGKHDNYQGILTLETMNFAPRSYTDQKDIFSDFVVQNKITSRIDGAKNDPDSSKIANRFKQETTKLQENQPDYVKGIFSETPYLVYSANIKFPLLRIDVLSTNAPKSINIDLWHLSNDVGNYQGPMIVKNDTNFKLDEQTQKNAPKFEALKKQLFIQQPKSVVLGNSFNIPVFSSGELHKNAIRFHSGSWDFDASSIEAPGLGKTVVFPKGFEDQDFYNTDPYETWGGKGLWVDRVFSYGNPTELLVGYWIPIQSHSQNVQGEILDTIHNKWINHSQRSGATGVRSGNQDVAIQPYFGGHSFRSEGSFHFYDTNTGILWLEGIKEGDGQNFYISGINIKSGAKLKTFGIPSTVFGNDEKFGNFLTNYVAPETIALSGSMAFMIPRMEESFGIVYNLGENKKVCDVYWGDKGQLLISLPENYYAATANAFEKVAFRQGNAAYPFEQFDLRLNRPDFVLDRLGAPKEAIEAAKSLRDKRLKRMGVTEEMLKPDFHLPELQIAGDVPATTPKDQLDLRIKATDDKYPLDRLRVYVNNVPVNGRDGELLRDQKTQSLERTIPIKLAAGRNKIQVSVLNSAGAESLYANAEVNCTAERPKPKLYAVALGVSQYERPEWCLKYAAKDATDLVGKLKDKAGSSYSEVKPLLLTDKEVTKESTAKIKEFLSGATIDDTVLIFMAGHGILDDKYDYYFGTTDIDPAKPSERGMPYEAIDNILAEVPSLKKALLMDTCHAGELDQDEKKELAASDGKGAPVATDSPLAGKVAMRSIGTRGMQVKAVEGAKGKSDWYEKLQDMFVDLRRGSGATVISSSQGAEYAFESSEQSNGLFTYSLMEALDGKATPNKDGQITISTVGDYVKKRVQDLTKGKQNPNLRGVNLEEDFTLSAAK